jgi:opacity protein-like surface antigen
MTRFKILGAAAILASALASPAMAQQAVDKGAGNTGQFQRQDQRQVQRHVTYRHDRNRRDYERRADRDSGFWPANAAAGVVGGAVATAGAIATAPFRGADAYAWDNGNNDYYGYGYGGRDWKTYAGRNGLACTPGTTVRGEDGRRYPCQ